MRSDGDLPATADLEGLAKWVLFIRAALWADTKSSESELRDLLTSHLFSQTVPESSGRKGPGGKAAATDPPKGRRRA